MLHCYLPTGLSVLQEFSWDSFVLTARLGHNHSEKADTGTHQ